MLSALAMFEHFVHLEIEKPELGDLLTVIA